MAGQRALISGRGVVASIAPGLSMVLESIDKFLSHMSLFTISAMHFRTSVQRLICRIFFCIPSYQARPYSELTGSLFTPPTPPFLHPFPSCHLSVLEFPPLGRTDRTEARNKREWPPLLNVFLVLSASHLYCPSWIPFYRLLWFTCIIEISTSCISFILAL